MNVSQAAVAMLYAAAVLLGGGLAVLRAWMQACIRVLTEESSARDACALWNKELPLIGRRRRKRRRSALWRGAGEFLLCIVGAVAFILMFYQINGGRIRYPAFLCALVGGLAAWRLLHRAVETVSETALFAVSVLWGYGIYLLFLPIRQVAEPIRRSAARRRKRMQGRERLRITERAFSEIPQAAEMLFGNGKGDGRHEKAKKDLQPEPAGARVSGSDRGGFAGGVRQQRDEI